MYIKRTQGGSVEGEKYTSVKSNDSSQGEIVSEEEEEIEEGK